MIYYCDICEKEMEGYKLTIDNDIYFVCKNAHKTRIKQGNKRYCCK